MKRMAVPTGKQTGRVPFIIRLGLCDTHLQAETPCANRGSKTLTIQSVKRYNSLWPLNESTARCNNFELCRDMSFDDKKWT